jgi:hypothetical protein
MPWFRRLVPLLALLVPPFTARAATAPRALVRVQDGALQRAAGGWPALTAAAVAPAIDAADAAWARSLTAAPADAASAYDAQAIIVPDGGRRPARTSEERAALLRDWSARWGAVREIATRFRAALGATDVLEVAELSTASGARPVLLTWWRARGADWKKLAEVSAERQAGAAPGTDADVGALEALRARWQELVDAKDPEALAAGGYDADARYLRLWDGSRRLYEGHAGIAEEYGTYILAPRYRLVVEPLAVVLASGTRGFVVGRFDVSSTGLAMRGLFAWFVTRRSADAPWLITFETDHAEDVAPAEP